jgi:hypothetical protein
MAPHYIGSPSPSSLRRFSHSKRTVRTGTGGTGTPPEARDFVELASANSTMYCSLPGSVKRKVGL